jgi:hypothetical protein
MLIPLFEQSKPMLSQSSTHPHIHPSATSKSEMEKKGRNKAQDTFRGSSPPHFAALVRNSPEIKRKELHKAEKGKGGEEGRGGGLLPNCKKKQVKDHSPNPISMPKLTKLAGASAAARPRHINKHKKQKNKKIPTRSPDIWREEKRTQAPKNSKEER